MMAALRRYAEGRPTRVPFRFAVHLIAVRYGVSPGQVLEWPADLYREALAFLPYTGGADGG